MDDPVPQPFDPHEATVAAGWVDFNGHMNVAYYVMVFDHATDGFLDHVGLGVDYVRRAGASVFAVESHVAYLAEVLEGARVRVRTRVLGYDRRRIHLFLTMHPADGAGDDGRGDGDPVATYELILVHVDMAARQAAPMTDAAIERIAAVHESQSAFPAPAGAGRSIGLGRGPPA